MDCMQAAKNCPGLEDVNYCSAMNISPLPTMIYQVAGSIAQAYNIRNDQFEPLGRMPYTLMMYCPSLSARFGNAGSADISASDRLGGFAILQFEADELDDPAINRSIF